MKKSLFPILLFFAVSLSAQPKYVFYFVGDGMGANHVMLTEMYRAVSGGSTGIKPLCMTHFPVSGLLSTFSASSDITDSAAAATCLASGVKTSNGTLGLDAQGNPVSSIAEQLHRMGWGVGIATSVSIDHATPAAFYAHVSKRNDFFHIGQQLAHSGFDFFAGRAFYNPTDPNEPDVNLYKLCEENGYFFAHGYKEAKERMRDTERLILVPEKDAVDMAAPCGGRLPYAIDRKPEDLTLAQITETAIAFLASHHDRFFLMVEGGAIDLANHANDAATSLHEVMDLDNAVEMAFRFYHEHPDETLIIVTADHETGGLALGNGDYALDLKLLASQHSSADVLTEEIKAACNNKKTAYSSEILPILKARLGLYDAVPVSKEEDQSLAALVDDPSALAKAAVALLNNKCKLAWATPKHTASPIPLFAVGVGAELFSGWRDNSSLAPRLCRLLGVSDPSSLRLSPRDRSRQ